MGLLAKLQGQPLEHLDLDYYTMALQFTAISRVFFYCPLLWSFPVFIFISILAHKILTFCSYTRTGNNELLWVFIHNTLKHLLHKCSHTDVEISFPRTGTEPSPRGLPQNIHILQQLLRTNEACTFLCFYVSQWPSLPRSRKPKRNQNLRIKQAFISASFLWHRLNLKSRQKCFPCIAKTLALVGFLQKELPLTLSFCLFVYFCF